MQHMPRRQPDQSLKRDRNRNQNAQRHARTFGQRAFGTAISEPMLYGGDQEIGIEAANAKRFGLADQSLAAGKSQDRPFHCR